MSHPPDSTRARDGWILLFWMGVFGCLLLLFQFINGFPLTTTLVIEPDEIREVDGVGYRWKLPEEQIAAVVRYYDRRVWVSEDGKPLGPVLSGRPRVLNEGAGRFNVTDRGNLWFSTSDNSDPSQNGRTYSARLPLTTGWWSWAVFLGLVVVPGYRLFRCGGPWVSDGVARVGVATFEKLRVPLNQGALMDQTGGPPLRLPAEGWAGLGTRRALVVAAVATLLVVSRMIHVLADASFWSEDGSVFFAAAWRGHEAGIFQPHAGYLNAVPRTLALIFEPFDLKAQPTLYLIACLALFFGTVLYLANARLPAGLALFLPLAMAIVPHRGEVFQGICLLHFVFTPALAVAALVGSMEQGARKWLTLSVVIFAGLSGPQVVLLLPLFWLGFVLAGPGWRKLPVPLAATIAAGLQVTSILGFGSGQRQPGPLPDPGMVFENLVHGFAAPVVMGQQLSAWFPMVSAVVACGLVAALAVACLRKRPLFWPTAFFGYTAAVLAASAIASPTGGIDFFHPFSAGQRYWYVPGVVLTCFAWCMVFHGGRWRGAWLLLSALLLFSSLASWKWARVGADLRWGPQVEMLEQSGQGSVKWRPGWEMWLRITPREAKMLFPAPRSEAAVDEAG